MPSPTAAPPHDPAWLDAQYNNRARIPEHPQIFARWGRDSAQARAQLHCQLDLPYGDGAGATLDVFPSGRPGAPVLLFIHGGWWRSLDKRDHSFVAPAFVQAGATVVIPNYALCPAVGIDHIAVQMAHALAWTWRHAADWGADRDRLVIAGHSAGAHLAALLLGCDADVLGADLPPPRSRRALAISGVFDLEPVRHTPFLQADLQLSDVLARRLSPVHHPRPAGRLWAAVGADESAEFLRQNGLLRRAWGPRTVPVCEVIAGRHHLGVVDDLAHPQGRLHRLALDLMGLGEPSMRRVNEC